MYLFDGTNFANWSFRMKMHLEELGLLPCIQQLPEEVAEYQVLAGDSAEIKREKEKALDDRRKKDVRCKSVLIRNIADSQLEAKAQPGRHLGGAAECFRAKRHFWTVFPAKEAIRVEIRRNRFDGGTSAVLRQNCA